MIKSNPTVFQSVPASESQSHRAGFFGQLSWWSQQHPVLAIILVAWLAVLINCYPVIFCQRSYVSQTSIGAMVYSWWPPLPGNDPAPYVSQHGTDTAAMMVWGVPVGFVESRSVWQQGELPLWNRYGHAGDPLIGQAVSMLGDPLQWIVILGHGSAGAWDIKFLTAKFLFCFGFGWLILRFFGNHPLALIYAALTAYCGAFFYINNHPVFFVFCYAPWILHSALVWLDLRSTRPVRWGLVWLLANVACFNAGHVEVAVDLIGGLNLAALVCVAVGCRCFSDLAGIFGRMTVGTLFFLGLTAPMWLSFLVSLDGAYSVHSEVKVFQLPLMSLPGLFDDEFYQLLIGKIFFAAPAPGTSLLVLSGCMLSWFRWRQSKAQPFFWVNSAAIVLWLGCAFKLVPASILATIPFLNRVGHTYTDFSYPLVIHLTIQSAYGFMALAAERDFRRVTTDFFWLGLGFGAIMLAGCFGNPHQPIPWSYFVCAAVGALGAPWLFMFLKNRRGRVTAVGWAGIIILGYIPNFRFGLYNFGNDSLLLLPGPRVVLNAPSAAVQKIQAGNPDPFRSVGLGPCFFGDYSAVYGIEDIRSCAPISSGKYIDLVCRFPGIKLAQGWVIDVADLSAAQPLLNLLNVKYLLANPRTQVAMDQGVSYRIAGRSDFLVLENLQAWPRAFFADKIVPDVSYDEFVKQLWLCGKNPMAALAPEEIKKIPGLLALLSTNPATVVPAKNYQLRVNSTAFDIHATSAGVVCLTEGQANDFTATANGLRKQVLTVNRAFKGVYLDRPGDYHIEFIYRPRYWTQACICFWLCIGAVALLGVTGILSDRKNAKPN